MADHGEVRERVAALLTRGAPWRFLPLRGPSETGKTHITRRILANALALSWLACGRFDFKGGVGLEVELRGFCQDLEVAPPAPAPLAARLSQIFDALKRRTRPALLVFDTYEAAGEAADWVKKELLPGLVRAPWLRVVIAGQRVPKSGGAVWESLTDFGPPLAPPPPEEWLAFGRPHKPGITLEFVRQAHQCCEGRSSVLAALLGRSD